MKVGEYSESSVHTIHAQKLGNKVAIEIDNPTTLRVVSHILYVHLVWLKFCVNYEDQLQPKY